MKIKYLLFVLAVFSVFLGVSLLLSEEEPLRIISSPKIYSMKHTELNETFKISVLMNRNDTYHLDSNYISKSTIKDGDDVLPISIELIEVSKDKMTVKEEEYYLVNYVISLDLEMSDHIISYESASLEIVYINQQVIDVFIGEFNYIFKENSNDISMYNLHATFGDVNNINTVTGIAIELHNYSSYNTIINRIDIVSKDASLNNDYLIEKDRDIDMFEEVKDVLVTSVYQFDSFESEERHHPILEGQTKKLYIPLLYNDEIKYISRFVIKVTYQMNGEEKVHYIDDFIFMNALHYGPEFEKDYRMYVYENN